MFTLAGHHFLQPLIIFHDHLHICSSRSIVSLFSGPRIESTTPVSPERSRGAKSPLTCCPHCGNEPGTWRGFCQPIHMAGSCPVLHPASQVLLLGHTLNQLITNPISISEIALIQMQDLALGPVDLHELHTRQSTQPIQNPLDAVPCLRPSTSPLTLVSSQSCQGYTQTHSPCPWKRWGVIMIPV